MATNGAPTLRPQALGPEYVMGPPVVTLPTESPLEQVQCIVSSIGEHAHPPHHQLRWNSEMVLARMREAIAIFYAHLACIASSLELHQWKTTLIETTQIIDNYVTVTLGEDGGFIHLDCPIIMEIAEMVHDALAAYSRQYVRFNNKIGGIEVQLGWTIGNKYSRTLTPDGFQVHCGFANCVFLNLLWVCNRCIGAMRETDIVDNIPIFSPNLAFLIVDKTVECYNALRSIFTRSIAVEGLMDWFCCIALPASLIESLNAGLTTAQQRELVKILIFRPLKRMTDTRLKTPDGVGGFALYHNCSFLSSSWCLTIDSQQQQIGTYTYILDGLVRQHTIVLELPTLTVESLASMIHNSSYANWFPTETVHRHCTLPLTHLEIEGTPELYHLSESCAEIAADDIANSASAGIDSSTDSVPSSLTREEYNIMLSTAAAIAKKRKGDKDSWEDWNWQLRFYVKIHCPLAVTILDTALALDIAVDDSIISSFSSQDFPEERLLEFSTELHYLLVKITKGFAGSIVRTCKHENGMETLSRIFLFEFRKDFFEEDFIAFIVLKKRYEALSGFLRLHQDALGTFDRAVDLVKSYCRREALEDCKKKRDFEALLRGEKEIDEEQDVKEIEEAQDSAIPPHDELEIPPSLPHAEGTTVTYLSLSHGCFDVEVTAQHYIPTPLTASAGLPPLHVTHVGQSGPVATAPPLTVGLRGRLAPLGPPDSWVLMITYTPPLDEFWPHSMLVAEGDSFLVQLTPDGWQLTIDKQVPSAARETRRGEKPAPQQQPKPRTTPPGTGRPPTTDKQDTEKPTTEASSKQPTSSSADTSKSPPTTQGERRVHFAADTPEPLPPQQREAKATARNLIACEILLASIVLLSTKSIGACVLIL
ncbi:unnamed protein product [Symbiodinium sp. CCMP2592]|nr:unnamed protein product [Symbiodinium sp. CCMP2592]